MTTRIWGPPLSAAVLALAGCGDAEVVAEYPVKDPATGRYERPGNRPNAGEGGISLFDFGNRAQEQNAFGVNRHLWNASLDVLSPLPLRQVDPYGGVILTEWSQDPESPDQRTQVTARITGVNLEAAALRVSVHRQTRDASGEWLAASVQDDTVRKITDSILTRAREIRVAELAR